MRRIISGIPFIAHSPSHFILDAIDDGSFIDFCQLWFNGSHWLIHLRLKNGQQTTRSFTSRDEAVAAMGGRRNVA